MSSHLDRYPQHRTSRPSTGSSVCRTSSPNFATHHLQNRSQRDAVLLTVGTRDDADSGEYPDVDLKFLPGRYSGGGGYTRKDGRRY